MIVDDQDIIRTGLIMMLGESDIDFGEVYEAANGMDALSLAKRKNPDIALVDIMMPQMDGIELIRKLQEEGLKTRIIIISAYNDFDTAKKAITLNVSEYLLKPVMKNELYDALIKLISQIQAEELNTNLQNQAQRVYLQSLLYDYLTGINIYADIDWLIISLMRQPQEDDYYFIVAGSMIERQGSSIHQLLLKIQSIACQLSHQCISFIASDNRMICLFPISDHNWEMISQAIDSTVNNLSGYFQCGLSSVMQGSGSLRELYMQAERALKEAHYLERPLIRFADLMQSNRRTISPIQKSELIKTILSGQGRLVNEKIGKLFLELSVGNLGLHEIAEAIIYLAHYIVLNIPMLTPDALDMGRFSKGIHGCDSLFACKVAFVNWINEILVRIDESKGTDGKWLVIQSVTAYVLLNYQKNLSLAWIANELNMNYSYISSQFSKRMGMSFSEYVMSVRLEKAQEKLSVERLKIHEVAEQCGFYDSQYFCKVFKKKYGKTPGEYKRL